MGHLPVLTAARLIEVGQATLAAAGTPPAAARAVATSLVESDLRGHDSHGIVRTLAYLEKIRGGQLSPDAVPVVARQHGATATVDGRWGFGQLAARLGADQAVDLAKRSGIGLVALNRTNHVGRLGEYVETVAGRGLIGLAVSGGAAPGGAVAPYGGRERIFGTNPLAWAAPAGPGQPPLVGDFASAATAEGKLAVARASGRPVPSGLLVDRHGQPTTDPADFYAGGALLPFGGHKGYSLLVMVELLATILAGAAPVSSGDYQPGNPTLLIAVSIDTLVPLPRFEALAAELVARVRGTQPAPDQPAVLLPGDIEQQTRQARSRDGVPVPDAIWRQLVATATTLGVGATRLAADAGPASPRGGQP